jgi:hypothetical protein
VQGKPPGLETGADVLHGREHYRTVTVFNNGGS